MQVARWRKFTASSRFSLAITVCLLSGCTDRDTTPLSTASLASRAVSSASASSGTEPISIEPRFDLDVDVEGALKPGVPFHLTVRGTVNYQTLDGEIRLILPEIAAAEKSSWDVVEVPVGQEAAPLMQVRKSFSAGERFRERVMITIPEPGYYSLAALALQHSDDRATDGARLVGGGAAKELWLWIDERGGQVTERFNPDLFPTGMRRIRGPAGSESKPPRLHDGGSYHITCTLIPGDGLLSVMSACPGYEGGEVSPPPGPDATAVVSVTYNDLGTGVRRVVPDAYLSWKIVNTTTNTVVTSGAGYTNANGESPLLDCKGPTSERRLELTVHSSNRKAEVKSYLTSNLDRTLMGQFVGACGGSIPISADNQQAHLFINLNKNWDGHTRVFGITPPTILRAGLYPPSSYGTRYDWDANEVRIEPANFDHIWREFGVIVAAHEWGHLWQDKYLYQPPASNGLQRFYLCPHDHYPWLATNFGCAIAEGFADWYAVLIRESDVPSWRRDLEENTQHLLKCLSSCSDDGSVVQGAVSAFLWDITDPPFTETWDRVQKPASDVTNSIRACEVAVNWNDFKPYTGIDHLIWCMEHRFPYQVRMQTASGERLVDFFPFRSKSNWAIDARGPMVYGFSDDFRRLWLVNLYSKRDYVGQTPIFRTILPSEDPSVQQPLPEEPTDPSCTQTATGITCPAL